MATQMPATISVRWTTLRAILTGLAIALIGSLPLSLLAPINQKVHPEWPWAAAVVVLFLAGLAYWLNGGGWPAASSAKRRYYLRVWRPAKDAWSPAYRLQIIGLVIAIAGIYVFWDVVTHGNEITDFTPYPTTAYRISLFVMGAVVSGGVEEMAFRGYMQSQLERIGPSFAVMVTSVVFALAHATHGLAALLALFPGYLIIGLCFSQLALRTGSILPGMLLHIVGDASHAFFVLLGGDATRFIAH